MGRLIEIVGVLTAIVLIVKTLHDIVLNWRASRNKKYLGTLFLILCLPSLADAQLWSSVLDSSRATDWTYAGVTGGIPNRTTICSTVSPYGSLGSPQSSSTINNAIQSCAAAGGGVVQLQAGTYYLSDS